MNLLKLSVVGAALAASSAFAVPTLNGGASELVLGFSSSSGSSDLEVALGDAQYYKNLASTGVFIITNLAADLTTAFGPSAYTATTSWGVIGYTSASTTSNVLYATKERSDAAILAGTAGSSIQGYLRRSASNQAVSGSAIGGLQVALTGTSNNATNGSAAVVTDTTPGSWTNMGGAELTSGNAFQTVYTRTQFNNDLALVTTPYGAGGLSVSDLYQMSSTSATSAYGTYVGTFAIDGSGNLLFTKDASLLAIPEPSTYAAILAGLTLGVVAYRRRFASKI